MVKITDSDKIVSAYTLLDWGELLFVSQVGIIGGKANAIYPVDSCKFLLSNTEEVGMIPEVNLNIGNFNSVVVKNVQAISKEKWNNIYGLNNMDDILLVNDELVKSLTETEYLIHCKPFNSKSLTNVCIYKTMETYECYDFQEVLSAQSMKIAKLIANRYLMIDNGEIVYNNKRIKDKFLIIDESDKIKFISPIELYKNYEIIENGELSATKQLEGV